MTLVVDASVAIKLFVQEPQSEAAERLFAREELLVPPGHFLGEIGEVAVRRRRSREISLEQMAVVRNVMPNALVFVPVKEIFDAALRIAFDAAISFYDALYVATVERWGALLVTADERLLTRLRTTGSSARVMSLADWRAPRTNSPDSRTASGKV